MKKIPERLDSPPLPDEKTAETHEPIADPLKDPIVPPPSSSEPIVTPPIPSIPPTEEDVDEDDDEYDDEFEEEFDVRYDEPEREQTPPDRPKGNDSRPDSGRPTPPRDEKSERPISGGFVPPIILGAADFGSKSGYREGKGANKIMANGNYTDDDRMAIHHAIQYYRELRDSANTGNNYAIKGLKNYSEAFAAEKQGTATEQQKQIIELHDKYMEAINHTIADLETRSLPVLKTSGITELRLKNKQNIFINAKPDSKRAVRAKKKFAQIIRRAGEKAFREGRIKRWAKSEYKYNNSHAQIVGSDMNTPPLKLLNLAEKQRINGRRTIKYQKKLDQGKMVRI